MFKFIQEYLKDDEENLLGSGTSGQVFPYQEYPQDMRWAVKRILAKSVKELIGFLPEIVLGFCCNHPCVVPVQRYFVEPIPALKYFHVYLRMPRMRGGSLSKEIKNRQLNSKPFTEKEIIQHFYSLTCGLRYLHSKKIYHGDIRHDNLLLDENGNLKIADVGIAKHVENEDSYQTVTGQKGTYQYSAPEILGAKAKKDLLANADVWSLGVVIFELCAFDYRLFDSSLPQDKLESRLNELFGSIEGKYQKELIVLMKRLLSLNPSERPDMKQIKDELEKSFGEILNQDLINFEIPGPVQMTIQSEDKIAVLNQHIKEISDKFEMEIDQLNRTISQLKQEKAQQKQEDEDRIQLLTNNHLLAQKQVSDQLEEERKTMSEELASKNETLRSIEEQIRSLQQAKASSEQKSKELERYIETTVKEQMGTYEAQIKVLQLSLEKEEIKFNQHEAERNKLKEMISQVEIEQAKQKQQYEDQIQVLLSQEANNRQEFAQLEAKSKEISQKLASNNEELRGYEEKIQSLQQEKASSEQKNRKLENYVETTVKDQMKTYEDQIKALKESQEQERIKFNQEKNKLLKDFDTLQFKVKELENPKKVEVKRESFGKDYEENLKKVVSQLDAKFNQWFEFKAYYGKLMVSVPYKLQINL